MEEKEDPLDSKVGTLITPGDIVAPITDLKIRLGPGLLQYQENIVATKCGILRNPQPKYYWIENYQKKYVPAVEDMVIGVVTDRHAESFKVNLGGAFLATLSALAFEGVTRKNRPNLQVGTLVYARVVVANKDMEPEIVCVSARNKAEGYGELSGGYMFKTSISLAYRPNKSLLDDDCVVLHELGKILPFEIAVGMNGRVWVNSSSPKNTILISNALLNSEFLTAKKTRMMVRKLADLFSK